MIIKSNTHLNGVTREQTEPSAAAAAAAKYRPQNMSSPMASSVTVALFKSPPGTIFALFAVGATPLGIMIKSLESSAASASGQPAPEADIGIVSIELAPLLTPKLPVLAAAVPVVSGDQQITHIPIIFRTQTS